MKSLRGEAGLLQRDTGSIVSFPPWSSAGFYCCAPSTKFSIKQRDFLLWLCHSGCSASLCECKYTASRNKEHRNIYIQSWVRQVLGFYASLHNGGWHQGCSHLYQPTCCWDRLSGFQRVKSTFFLFLLTERWSQGGSSWGWPWCPHRRHCLWCKSRSQDSGVSWGLSWRSIPSAGRDTGTGGTSRSASSI